MGAAEEMGASRAEIQAPVVDMEASARDHDGPPPMIAMS